MMEDNKEMAVKVVGSLRDLVYEVNANNIKREDIVSIMKEDGEFYLVYYK